MILRREFSSLQDQVSAPANCCGLENIIGR
jgi:hypothetical protein